MVHLGLANTVILLNSADVTAVFPDLSQYPLVSVDTETTGKTSHDRPVGCSVTASDGNHWYFSWGAGDPAGLRGPVALNNCSLPDFVRWANVELRHPRARRVMHFADYDLRMLAYVGVRPTNVECTHVAAAVLNENRPSFSLDVLLHEAGLPGKQDTALHQWMVEHLPELRNKQPTRKVCAPHYWRVPASVIAEYALGDSDGTLALHHHFAPQIFRGDAYGTFDPIYQLETGLLPLLLEMHLTGVRVDRPRAKRLVQELTSRHNELESAWRKDFGDINYRSGQALGPVLDRLGVAYPLTKKTKVASITKEYLEQLDHPIGERLRQLRQFSHYRDTFINGYILENTTDDDDILRPEFHALRGDEYGTISGRFSSGGELNAQNIPARDEYWAPLIRSLFRPMRDDQDWLKLDYSQIEYRLFAHYAGVRAQRLGRTSAMEQAYINNPLIDFHTWVAETADIKRKRAKNVNFCRLYGGGIAKIALTAGCSYEEAEEFVKKYDQAIPEASALMADVTRRVSSLGMLITWAGRRCRFPTEGELHARALRRCKTDEARAKVLMEAPAYPNRVARAYKGLNGLLQGSAADLIKRAMLAIYQANVIDWSDTQLHLTVHDELDLSIPKGDAGARKTQDIKSIMQEVGKLPAWDGRIMRVPVIAEASVGANWGMAA